MAKDEERKNAERSKTQFRNKCGRKKSSPSMVALSLSVAAYPYLSLSVSVSVIFFAGCSFGSLFSFFIMHAVVSRRSRWRRLRWRRRCKQNRIQTEKSEEEERITRKYSFEYRSTKSSFFLSLLTFTSFFFVFSSLALLYFLSVWHPYNQWITSSLNCLISADFVFRAAQKAFLRNFVETQRAWVGETRGDRMNGGAITRNRGQSVHVYGSAACRRFSSQHCCA